jgi:GxxExxY protein
MNHHTEFIGKIAHEVYQNLGSGFSEDVYDRAMQVGLRLVGVRYESEKVVELKYLDHCVGEGWPELVVHIEGQNVVIELKAVTNEVGAREEKQLRNYMKILGVECGLLINFQASGRKQGPTRSSRGRVRMTVLPVFMSKEGV